MIRSYHKALLLTLIATAFPLAAQEKQVLNVRTLLLDGSPIEGAYLKKNTDFVKLRFSKRQLSQNYRADAGNPLPIFQESGEETYTPLATAKLPANAKRIILLGWKKEKNYSFTAIKDDFGSTGPNSWLLVNATKKAIAFQIGKDNKPTALKPGQSTSYRVSVDEERGAAATGMMEINGEMKTFYSTYWPIHKGKRNVILFLPKGKKVIVKKIIDQGLKEEGE